MPLNKPWGSSQLAGWDIIGMNHYYENGERRLFVAMTKGSRCIRAEGKDDEYLWNRLCHQVTAGYFRWMDGDNIEELND